MRRGNHAYGVGAACPCSCTALQGLHGNGRVTVGRRSVRRVRALLAARSRTTVRKLSHPEGSMSVAVLTSTGDKSRMRDARLKRFSPVQEAAANAGSAASATPRDQQVLEPGPTTAAIDSVALFKMGFDAERVGAVLVQTRGDVTQALRLLRGRDDAPQVHSSSAVAEDDDEDEQRQLELALKMSLEPRDARSHKTVSGANPLWAPPRYVPASNPVEAGSRTLNLVEVVHVRDGAYGWQRASAFLDTGNQHMTLVDTQFAARHAIYNPASATQLISSRSAFGQAERWTTIRGVVPGASTRAPVVTIALKVRDQEMLIQAAVSDMVGHDLLIGADVIAQLFAAGFRLEAGSM